MKRKLIIHQDNSLSYAEDGISIVKNKEEKPQEVEVKSSLLDKLNKIKVKKTRDKLKITLPSGDNVIINQRR